MKVIESLPYSVLIILSLTLGLAPFVPIPHLFEKIRMLFSGSLQKPADIFDLFFHGLPVALLAIKIVVQLIRSKKPS